MSALPQPLPDHQLTGKARAYFTLTAFLGGLVLSMAALNWESTDLLKFGGFLMIAVFSSGMRISISGITGTLSLSFLFVWFGGMGLTGPETIMLGSLVTLIQCCWTQPKRPRLAQAIFKVASAASAIAATCAVYNWPWMVANNIDPAIRLAAATCTLFLLNTMPLAMATALAEG